MEYTLFKDFTLKIPLPAPPTGRPGHAQSGRTTEFGYGPFLDTYNKTQSIYLLRNMNTLVNNFQAHAFKDV